eukprot:TRINITY_DN30286_c0_g2_i1.p1 TRINITY_DN30286_c0_g2~~TRINITY_DN30286_c0_g2_i1.p1  ORF type:complete len:353 (-),score=102.62 TRINITY_DN30286_c0_g2_i1:199-1257(-)
MAAHAADAATGAEKTQLPAAAETVAATGTVCLATEQVVPLLRERRAEEWHRDEKVHAERLAEFAQRARADVQQRERSLDWNVQLQRVGEEHAVQTCTAAEANERACAEELGRIREERVETLHATERTREDCEQQVGEIDRAIAAERERRIALERSVQEERAKLNEVWRRINAEEAAHDDATRAMENQISDLRSNAQREVLRVRQSASERVAKIEADARNAMEALQNDLQEELRRSKAAAGAEVAQREALRGDARAAVREVDLRIVGDLHKVADKVHEIQQASLDTLAAIQTDDVAHDVRHWDSLDVALTARACAADEARRAAEVSRKREKLRLQALPDCTGGLLQKKVTPRR